jgi:hypothetical protein
MPLPAAPQGAVQMSEVTKQKPRFTWKGHEISEATNPETLIKIIEALAGEVREARQSLDRVFALTRPPNSRH